MRIIHFFFILLFLNTCEEPPSEKEERLLVADTISIEPDTLPEVKAPIIDYDTSQWRELTVSDSVVLDLRYATTNNFVKEILYDCGRCFLRPEAAKALLVANDSLRQKGYRFKLFDCFRPLPVQQRLWDKFQNANYVTPPSKGSMHNRGLATDLTIVDEYGKELDMGTEFDFFGKEAHHDFRDLPEVVLENRKLLKTAMESAGFKGIRTEWWHYSFTGRSYALSDMLWNCEAE